MSGEQGFSLLETMVALAVFATAAIGFVSLSTNSIRISAELGERTLARQVAENVAVDTVTNPTLQVIGTSKGREVQRRQEFERERIITPAAGDGLVQIEVLVRPAGSDAAAARITLLHLAEAQP